MSESILSPFRPSSALDVQYVELPRSDLLVRRMNLHSRHQICALHVHRTDQTVFGRLPYMAVSIATEDGIVTLIHASVIEGAYSIVLYLSRWCLMHRACFFDIMFSGYRVPRCFHCFSLVENHEDGCRY